MEDKDLSKINKVNRKKLERVKIKKRKRRNRIIFTMLLVILEIFIGLEICYLKDKSLKIEKYTAENSTEVVISLGGNCVFGSKEDDEVFKSIVDDEEKGYKYFLEGIQSILSKDDFSIVNLESPLKRFKAEYKQNLTYDDYSNIIKSSSIEGVVMSNFSDDNNEKMIESLNNKSINVSDGENSFIKEINGVKIGIVGYRGWGLTDELKVKIASDIENLNRQDVKFIISYFNWGNRNETEANDVQKKVARFAIDNGADVVVGNFPESIQGVENYNGKFIAYSLGNLSFGGTFNENNMESYILQIKLNVEKEELVNVEYKVVPIVISDNGSSAYKTSMADEGSKKEIFEKLNKSSGTFKDKITEKYFEVN